MTVTSRSNRSRFESYWVRVAPNCEREATEVDAQIAAEDVEVVLAIDQPGWQRGVVVGALLDEQSQRWRTPRGWCGRRGRRCCPRSRPTGARWSRPGCGWRRAAAAAGRRSRTCSRASAGDLLEGDEVGTGLGLELAGGEIGGEVEACAPEVELQNRRGARVRAVAAAALEVGGRLLDAQADRSGWRRG